MRRELREMLGIIVLQALVALRLRVVSGREPHRRIAVFETADRHVNAGKRELVRGVEEQSVPFTLDAHLECEGTDAGRGVGRNVDAH